MSHDPVFRLRQRVRYADCGPDLRADLPGLVVFLQEATVAHKMAVGQGPQDLSPQGLGWMLVHYRARVHTLPSCGAEVTTSTWSSETGNLLCRREFLLDTADQRILEATSLWAFVDIHRRRPTRLPAQVRQGLVTHKVRALEGTFSRIEAISDAAHQQVVPLCPRHLDFYGHVNNLRYLAWMADTLPGELRQRFCIAGINLRFERECTRSQGQLRSRVQEVPAKSDGQRRFLHDILDEDDRALAVAETCWRR